MGMSISTSKRKKSKFRRTLSKNSVTKLSGKMSVNESNRGFFNKFINDVKLNGKRNSKQCSSLEDDFIHNIIQILWECDFKAPVKDILNAGNARVLDVATGKGTWVMQCAENYPWSNFTGVDAIPIFPRVTSIKLMNATFLQSDVLKKLLFEDNTFDFVHMRCLNILNIFYTDKEWEDQVLKEIIRVCKPGGWIELVELDCEYINQGPTHKKVSDSARRYFLDHDMKPISGENLVYYLKQSGKVTEINEEIKNIPFYGSKIGKAFNDHLIKFIQSYKDILSSYMGYDHDEWEETIKTIKKEFVEYKTEGIMRRVYCKKNCS